MRQQYLNNLYLRQIKNYQTIFFGFRFHHTIFGHHVCAILYILYKFTYYF